MLCSESDDPMWRGILYSVLILLFATVQTVFLSQYFYRMYIVGMWSKSALISAIYRSFKTPFLGAMLVLFISFRLVSDDAEILAILSNVFLLV